MLSIIVCSINPAYLQAVTKNIEETIGINFELLTFDNRNSRLGICEVYNRQASLAQYPFLLFLHEDVVIETKNWGLILVEIFKTKSKCGVIGLAGSNYKSRMYSGWYTNIPENDAYNIIHYTDGEEVKMTYHRPEKSNVYEVVCVDGVFIATTKEVWIETNFNENKLKGFHFYDLDFSLRASAGKKIYVTMDIDVMHITKGGDFGNKWVEQAFIFHEYMKELLPIPKNEKVSLKTEIYIANTWLDYLKNFNISFSNKLKWIVRQRLYKYPSLYYGITKFIVYKPLRLKQLHNLKAHRLHK